MLYIKLHYVKTGVIFIDFISPNYSVFERGNKQINSATIIKGWKTLVYGILECMFGLPPIKSFIF